MTPMQYLSEEQLKDYDKNGYLVVSEFFDEKTVEALRNAAHEIVSEFDASTVSVFSTKDQVKLSDQYFIESAENVSCFFEEDAFDRNGALATDKQFAINKIGHALHDLKPTFRKASYSQKLKMLMQDLGFGKPVIAQSQYIFKQPKIGGLVNPHMDATFLYTNPISCTGIWVALEDATINNGCLYAIPASHKNNALPKRFVKETPTSYATKFEKLPSEEEEWDVKKAIPLEVKKGDMVVLHGKLVHFSYENRSTSSRHAYVMHLIEGNYAWDEKNWLQRSEKLPFKSLFEEVL